MGRALPPWAALAPLLLPTLLGPRLAAAAGPAGSVTARATQTRQYGSQVKVSYFEAVNCTLDFDQDVSNFNASSFTKAATIRILNVVQISPSRYDFQVTSDVNANVSIYIAPQMVQNTSGFNNSVATAHFSFEFLAFPPSVTLKLDGYEGQSSKKDSNVAYLLFNSTTEYNGTSFFNESFVSISPYLEVQNFQQVNDNMYSFSFRFTKNTTAGASVFDCVLPNTSLPSAGHTLFRCSGCERPQLCLSETRYPPGGVDYLEFPFEVVVAPVPGLGMAQVALPLFFDTLWADVSIEAPAYANGPFFLTVTWTETMRDLFAVEPVFAGLTVDQDVLRENRTTLSPSSYRLLVTSTQTGVLTISINGTYLSIDQAGNTNDFRRNPSSRTGAQRVVVFSAGPPLAGSIAFAYQRPAALAEYGAAAQSSVLGVPSLTVSWSGFLTAVQYDLWIQWGHNMSWPVIANLTSDSFHFGEFHAMLGVEYTAYVRAWNIWNASTTVTKVFLHPQVNMVADGSHSTLRLPDLLGPWQTNVTVHALIPQGGFLSFNTLKVLSFRTADRSVAGGDADSCLANSQFRSCTWMNFHVEVPATEFVVFRKPISLHFAFGQRGWEDLAFRPQLQYWETHQEEWRSAASTCPPEQVYESWDTLHRIYAVSFCHLTQFAVFELFSPPAATTPPPPPARPETDTGLIFFAILGGAVASVFLLCLAWYWACVRPSARRATKRTPTFDDMGIRPVTDRLPSRRLGAADPEDMPLRSLPEPARGAPQDDARRLLPALPAPGAVPAEARLRIDG